MTILASDNFTRANESPLNPTNWTIVTGSNGLQVLSNLCQNTVAATLSRELYTNATWPNDQYALFKVAQFTNGSVTDTDFLFVRGSTGTAANNYNLQIISQVAGNPTWNIQRSGTTLNSGRLSGPVSIGDTFAIKIVGTTLSAYWNGVLLGSATDATFGSGTPGLGVRAVSVGDMEVSYWEGGNIVQAAAPTFSPTAPYSGEPVAVTISTTTPGSTIYYTTDGSTPTTSSPSIPSGGTVMISATATLKAIALSNGAFDTASTETDGVYTITYTISGNAGVGGALVSWSSP